MLKFGQAARTSRRSAHQFHTLNSVSRWRTQTLEAVFDEALSAGRFARSRGSRRLQTSSCVLHTRQHLRTLFVAEAAR